MSRKDLQREGKEKEQTRKKDNEKGENQRKIEIERRTE